jgi:hypothetical protein
MSAHLRIVALVVTIGIFALIVDLVRRRRLLERYALLWLFSGIVLVALETWGDLLTLIGKTIGIVYPPTTLFLIAFGFVLALLVHFSTVISSLTTQNKVLAQRIALLQQRLDERPPGQVTLLPPPDASGSRRRRRFADAAIEETDVAPPAAGAR